MSARSFQSPAAALLPLLPLPMVVLLLLLLSLCLLSVVQRCSPLLVLRIRCDFAAWSKV